MGKLKVVGKARKEFTCDIMYIKLSFKAWGEDTSQAIATSMSQCDLFLEILEKQGIDINMIHMSNADVSQEMYEDKLEISAEREIELRMPFDMNVINRLSEIIKENQFKVDMDISFKLTNMLEVHEQLLKEAVLDSKKKAEMLASAMGQKVIGIETLNAADRYNSYDSEEKAYYDLFTYKLSASTKKSISNRLKAPLVTEYENVEVEWLIE